MSLFAVLDLNNIVMNTIVADTKEIAESATSTTCIEFNETNPVGVGWAWDGTSFIMPIVEEIIEEQITTEENK
ncbi:hypothetical protein uvFWCGRAMDCOMC403_01 [Freshwater phage uvFW-CGR-AMD-COM-C403]|nr:hypothetical protein uvFWCGRAMDCOMC403_01 [Freshwater phage uvFW-CGR-AMD-COM-C403]